ncbi:CoF synthetase [Pseudonocardia sp. UM4_GMWB1]|jgi:phenylacetate-CoA ligase|uniref:phenylacetate--CoA ligase family protein n=1 Tax=Pseudonocardia sp. UM4_GMWB1 TaxID=2212989 RepID=UPI00307CDED5
MLIADERRMTILREAQAEYAPPRNTIPEPEYYESRLRSSWDRARRSAAYRGLPDFSMREFENLPITTKGALKAAPLDFTTVELGASHKYYETTGTSGRPTPTPRLVEDVIWNVVSVAEAWRDVVEDGDRVAILLPSDLVPVGDLVVGVCEYLGVSHVRAYPFTTGIADWDRIAEMWRTFRPTVVFVAPGVAMHMTRLAKSRGELADLRSSTRVLMLLGEVSTEPFRDRLGQWWGGEVHDASYGSTETGTLAATCARSRLHLLPSAAYFELSDGTSTTPARGSGAGNLVVTPLRLHARPLLRVDTGDVVDLEVGCPCGSAVPIVQVHGRAAEEITVSGVALAVRDVETIVFGSAPVTTYLVEVDETRDCARLLLERDVDSDREQEPLLADRIRRHSQEHLGLEWDDVVFLNSLPAAAKSGASQKSWKRSNVRFVGADR